MTGFLSADAPVESLDAYFALGGGEGLELARTLGPARTIEQLSLAGLRGRGGAGFPTAAKWRSVASGGPGDRYVVCNAAEGEPGTFKDRTLLRANPYQVIEGLLIAANAVGAREAFVGLKASFGPERERVEVAIAEFAEVGMLEDVRLQVVLGPEEYLFGEEKALLEVIEGNEPLPRWLPPYLHGLFVTAPQMGWAAHEPERGQSPSTTANPTLVNNAETLANVTHILARGPEWFRTMGTPDSPGTVVCTVTGDVGHPGVFEVEMGTPLRLVLDRAGGASSGRSIRAVFPGVSNAVLTADQLDTPLSYEAMMRRRIGSGIGRVHRVRRHGVPAGRGPDLLPVPVRGVLWPVPALQARNRGDHRHARSARRRRLRQRTWAASRNVCGSSPMPAAATCRHKSRP